MLEEKFSVAKFEVRIFFEKIKQMNLPHHFGESRHQNLAAVFAREILVLFQDKDTDFLMRKKRPQNHSLRPTADNANINFMCQHADILGWIPKMAKRIPFLRSKIFLVLLFLLGLGVGFLLNELTQLKENREPTYHLQRLYPNGGHLINPLMQIDGPEGHDPRLESIKDEVESTIDHALKKNEAASISFYLRDLNKATWVGINADEKFTVASLAKVPLMFTFFLKAQQDPTLLNKKITYANKIPEPAHQNIPPKNTIQLGNTYTVDELLKNMIADSDNISMFLLAEDKAIDSTLAEQIYSDLRLPVPRPNAEYYISPKDYSRYFRLLYSSTYLNKDSSEKALRLLTETDFRDGIVAGIPDNIQIAHKFGERDDGVEGVQLHDCGIVYDSSNPYFICVMTKGWDFKALQDVIKNISKITYTSLKQGTG